MMDKQTENSSINESLSAEDKQALLKDKAFQDEVVKIASNVLTQLYKALWTKRSIWTASLKNKQA